MPGSNDLPHDPLNLEAADRAIRRNELNEQAKARSTNDANSGNDRPPVINDSFMGGALEYERAPLGSRFDQLVNAGVLLPEPASLDDVTLHAKLWEIINTLARLDVYLSHTDHLSDRELYTQLWSSSLREKHAIFPPGSGWVHHLDLLGGCSDEDIQIGLRFYAGDESRRHWAEDFPKMIIPPHEDPPFDRDRLLPEAPPPHFESEDERS